MFVKFAPRAAFLTNSASSEAMLKPKFGSMEARIGPQSEFQSVEPQFRPVETRFSPMGPRFGAGESRFQPVPSRFLPPEIRSHAIGRIGPPLQPPRLTRPRARFLNPLIRPTPVLLPRFTRPMPGFALANRAVEEENDERFLCCAVLIIKISKRSQGYFSISRILLGFLKKQKKL